MTGLEAIVTVLPVLIAAGLLGVFGWIFLQLLGPQHAHKAWRKVSVSLGLSFTPGTLVRADRIDGRYRGCEVAVYSGVREKPQTRTRDTTIEITGLLPPNLRIRREQRSGVIDKMLLGEDIKIGDRTFDWRALVRGEEVEALAFLTAKGRELVRALLDEGGCIEDGTLVWTTADNISDPAALEAQVKALIRQCNQLSLVGRSLPRRLATNATQDPVPEVRLRNLELLLAQRGEPLGVETAKRCLKDRHPPVALRAALALGDEGLHHIEELLNQSGVPSALRAEALAALGKRGEPALFEMLSAGGVTARAAAQALEVSGTHAAIGPLMVHVRAQNTEEALRADASKAVAAIQAREGGEAGGFAIADDPTQGAISLKDTDKRGALSAAQLNVLSKKQD